MKCAAFHGGTNLCVKLIPLKAERKIVALIIIVLLLLSFSFQSERC